MIDDIIINENGKEVTLKATGAGDYWYNYISGLESPAYRNTSVVAVGRNGGYTPKQLYGQRVIEIRGGIRACPDFMEAREKLLNALSFDEDVSLNIKRTDGRVFRLRGKFDQPDMAIDDFFMNEFQLVFLSSDLDFIDITAGNENQVDVEAGVSGGWKQFASGWAIYPAGWKIWESKDGGNAVNSSSIPISPIIEIYGPAQNPIVTNRTTGKLVKVNVTIGSGDIIKIDTALRTTTLNGGNINALVDASSTYFDLIPGENRISYSSDTNGYATVFWYDQYRRI